MKRLGILLMLLLLPCALALGEGEVILTGEDVVMEEAVEALERDSVITGTLGSHITEQYIQGKQREWTEYRNQITRWELEHYLITY